MNQNGAPEADPFHSMTPGGAFIYDEPTSLPTIWGRGDEVLWIEGEALLIAGPQGLGKTTLAGNLVAARIGITDSVLGLPVAEGSRVLYLAMDRPRQAARALRRQLGHAPRDLLDDRLVVWKGPPLADMAKQTNLLREYATRFGAGTVFVDSLKDAALGLSDDEVGAGWNRARQTALAAGIQVVELHHTRKGTQETPDINDVYGSTWITAGVGSAILLAGQPGDPLVKFHHIKQAMETVGPWTINHDQASGRMTVRHSIDVVDMCRSTPGGITAKDAAVASHETPSPSQNQVEKYRRKLDKLVDAGSLRKLTKASVTAPQRYVLADDLHGLGTIPESDKVLHDQLHAPDDCGTFTNTSRTSREDSNMQVAASRTTSRASRAPASRVGGSHKRPLREAPSGSHTQQITVDGIESPPIEGAVTASTDARLSGIPDGPATPWEVPRIIGSRHSIPPGHHTPVNVGAGKRGTYRAIASYRLPGDNGTGKTPRVERHGRTPREAYDKAVADLTDRLSTDREVTA